MGHSGQRRKIWLTPTILECRAVQPVQELVQDLDAKSILYTVPAQQTVKHRAKLGWLPMSDVAAVKIPRRETR